MQFTVRPRINRRVRYPVSGRNRVQERVEYDFAIVIDMELIANFNFPKHSAIMPQHEIGKIPMRDIIILLLLR